MEFKDDTVARNHILNAAFMSDLDGNRIDIITLTGINGKIMDDVSIHFPTGSASGTYEQIEKAIADATSFETLRKICDERSLTAPDD